GNYNNGAGINFLDPNVHAPTPTTLEMHGCTIEANTAMHGAGVYIVNGLAIFDHCEITGNQAQGDGGGIENEGTILLRASDVSSNHAANGGGIASSGILTIDGDSTINSNTATGSGGGIENDGFGKAQIKGGEFAGNTAQFGGAVDNRDNGRVTFNLLL